MIFLFGALLYIAIGMIVTAVAICYNSVEGRDEEDVCISTFLWPMLVFFIGGRVIVSATQWLGNKCIEHRKKV